MHLSGNTEKLGYLLITTLFVACTSMPEAVAQLPWRDTMGDRGRQVLSRDYKTCLDLVESRSSLLAGCMAQRGWVIQP
jgi:hypothetical protein